jgi:hypothetical protein
MGTSQGETPKLRLEVYFGTPNLQSLSEPTLPSRASPAAHGMSPTLAFRYEDVAVGVSAAIASDFCPYLDFCAFCNS